MIGLIEITVEGRDGSTHVHLSERNNYILKRSLAYLLAGTYGSPIVDPIVRYAIGSGGASMSNREVPISSVGTDSNASMIMEWVCQGQTLYNGQSLTKSIPDGLPVGITSVSDNYPTSVTYHFTIEFDEANGLDINEVGLITRTGKVFSHKTFPTLSKTFEQRIHVRWTIGVRDES